MPPVLKQLDDKPKTISEDPALTSFSTSKFVFTDVTFGLKNSDRSIVIRHPDGTLQEASYDVRKRICQTYFPISGREMEEPAMFNEANLKRLLAENEFEYILDNLCLQFEPFEERYHQVTSQVYQYIDEHEGHDLLRSTRHFGPMAFFFAWHKIIDNLLRDMIRRDYLRNAVELICLTYKLNAIPDDTSILKVFENINQTENQIQETIKMLVNKNQPEIKQIDKSNDDLKLDEMSFEFIQDYVKNHSSKKGQLERTLQSYKERHNELKSIAEGMN
jgi:small subunit ribosomal protein S22